MSEETKIVGAESEASVGNPPPAYAASNDGTAPGVSSKAPYPTQPGVSAMPPSQLPFDDYEKRMRYSQDMVKYSRYLIAFPLWLAITIACINIFIPGLGFWFGACFFCLGNTIVREDSLMKLVCIYFTVGLFCVATMMFGIGYMVAIAGSWLGVTVSRLYHKNPIEESEITHTPLRPGGTVTAI